eukprot:scaffold32979_cov54-Phaeocystis_antarctica.AAC.6
MQRSVRCLREGGGGAAGLQGDEHDDYSEAEEESVYSEEELSGSEAAGRARVVGAGRRWPRRPCNTGPKHEARSTMCLILAQQRVRTRQTRRAPRKQRSRLPSRPCRPTRAHAPRSRAPARTWLGSGSGLGLGV